MSYIQIIGALFILIIILYNSEKICIKCFKICFEKRFKQNFKKWTSGNDDIDKFIQNTQLLAHSDAEKALEWIPYDRFHNIKCIEKDKVYKANWIDGCINKWDDKNQNWERKHQNMFVILKSLYISNISELTLTNKIISCCKVYGITKVSETENYMVVLTCEKCNDVCNAIYFQLNFGNWTSGNNIIDEFIQDSQLSSHKNYQLSKALEWIPYNKFYDIECISKSSNKVYRANWIDGYINEWDYANQNWKRKDQNITMILKSLDILKVSELNKIIGFYKVYGITQDPETKNYIVVLICEKCNYLCNAIYFQLNFGNWTSGSNIIDKFIQDSQLLSHKTYQLTKVLEWIPYNKFYNIECILKSSNKVYRANWIDGYINKWDYANQNWERKGQNISMILKSLDHILKVSELIRTIGCYKIHGITQDSETENYMVVLTCEKCNDVCNAIYFQLNFGNWTSGNNIIDEIIQDSQLSSHETYQLTKVLEWIPYNKFYDIECILKSSNKVYRANWIDGYINKWDYANQNWERKGQNISMILKSLDHILKVSELIRVAIKFME
ncbi:hypothetical protein RhiirA5_436517 [Rhizophagus irregularis]|uniref:Uncharacterized protein n=1 Tax=Rhizophagus irregularis TaxID=588596 RepID=A0A2N0NLX6_9GLOM|nr:hypothetical protein RhiirA5_436517 [Rhizophagus irregularis]